MASYNGLGSNLSNLYRLSSARTRSISPENFTGEKGKGGMATPDKGTAGHAARELGQKWKVNPYIHIEPGECFYGGGAYFIDGLGLKRLRAAIDRDPDHLRSILRQVEKNVGPLQGEKLKRGPVGFEKDHPAMDLLLYTQMWVSQKFTDKLAGSRELVDWIVNKTRETAEFDAYLYEAIRGVEAP